MKKIILYFMLIFLSLPAWAELEVITLQHRGAEDVLPIVLPLLDKDGVASGMGNQLILRTSQRNLAEIKRLLQSIDIVPRRLRITVMQNVDSETVKRLTAMSGSVKLGRDARLTVPDDADNSGFAAEAGEDDSGFAAEAGQGADWMRARAVSTRSQEDDKKTQQVQVVEGGRALISVGQSVPQHQIVRSPWNTQVIDSTQYRDVSSGFYVRPHISGDRVTLEISAQNDALAPDPYPGNPSFPPATRVQQLNTTVSGRLGEWIELGDTSQQTAKDGSTISTRSMSDVRERRSVLLKVEEIP